MTRMVSAFDFLISKAEPIDSQVSCVLQFSRQAFPKDLLSDLRAAIVDRVPFAPNLGDSEVVVYWALAISYSDIGTVPSRERRALLLESFKEVVEKLNSDIRVVSALSAYADEVLRMFESRL